MNRKDFIGKAAGFTVFAKTAITTAALGATNNGILNLRKPVDPETLPVLSMMVQVATKQLFAWMKENGWLNLAERVSGISFTSGDPADPLLVKIFNRSADHLTGCDDFGGNKLIEPGYPAFSLLYHLLASPLTRTIINGASSSDPIHYPSLEHLDVLENFIYSLQQLPKGIMDRKNIVLAVFSYEYRPGIQTPHEKYADLVFARAGISRVGTQPLVYDKLNRCFTNKPVNQQKEKEIAVTPARYALFLAERARYDQIARWDNMKADDSWQYAFLRPIRKLFNGDPLLEGKQLFFSESHRNEKLRRVMMVEALQSNVTANIFRLSEPPFVRETASSTNPTSTLNNSDKWDKTLVQLETHGSSVTLASIPDILVRRAFQDVAGKQERVRLKIPAKLSPDKYGHTNRRYTSFKIISKEGNRKDAWDIIWENTIYRQKNLTNYHVPRNAAMFMNIREQLDEQGNIKQYLGPGAPNLQAEIDKSYWVGLFEDSLCDGCICAELGTSGENANSNPLDKISVLPAFSVVTAPDFFPYFSSDAIKHYEKLFLLGGVNDMGGARFRANPGIHLPGTEISAFPLLFKSIDPAMRNSVEEQAARTILSMLSYKTERNLNLTITQGAVATLQRSSYLPDSATRIFYPGWDITYAGPEDKGRERNVRFYATYGLGSPFVEDSKLCAAANGMWAAASPDSARTFRGSLTKVPTGINTSIYPPTAVPLLDIELGIHPQSPAAALCQYTCTGWDGEYGPYLRMDKDNLLVNFTDIGAADYVKNAMDNKFDMSKLRQITLSEMLNRMNALDRCNAYLPDLIKNFWLVGVETVADWAKDTRIISIPPSLHTGTNSWAATSHLSSGGPGYLYVFCKTTGAPQPLAGSGRCEMMSEEVWIFQLNLREMAACQLKKSNGWAPTWM